MRLFFPPNFWMTKIKPHENCEISSDGGHVPGLHKIVVMSFPGKEQSTLSSAFVKTKNGNWKITPAKKSRSVNHILQTCCWLFKISGWPFNEQVLPDFFNQQYHALNLWTKKHDFESHRKGISFLCGTFQMMFWRRKGVWATWYEIIVIAIHWGNVALKNNIPLSWKPIPTTKRLNKTNNTMFCIIFKVGPSFLAYILPPILGSGNKKSPGHKLPKLQTFGTAIVLILLEALNKLESLGDPREPINPKVFTTKLFYQQTTRWFRACPNTTTIGTWDNETS